MGDGEREREREREKVLLLVGTIMLPSTWSPWQVAGVSLSTVTAVTLAGLLLLRRRRRSRLQRPLKCPNFKPNTVYLFNFPSSRTIVSVSPFALKVETWLRVNGIEHSTTRKPFVWSSKGQIPFVELNGREINESNLILRELARHFGVREELSVEQMGVARAVEMMLEHRTVISYFYYRYVDSVREFIATWEFTGRLLRSFLHFTFPRVFRRRAMAHGIGRGGVKEIYDLGCSDIQALADLLGDKQFLFGDVITTVDCYAFGHLAQILYVPVNYPHKEYMRRNTPKLCQYVDRIRDRVWPDWDQVCVQNLHGSG